MRVGAGHQGATGSLVVDKAETQRPQAFFEFTGLTTGLTNEEMNRVTTLVALLERPANVEKAVAISMAWAVFLTASFRKT
jgi:hypothetical protein